MLALLHGKVQALAHLGLQERMRGVSQPHKQGACLQSHPLEQMHEVSVARVTPAQHQLLKE